MQVDVNASFLIKNFKNEDLKTQNRDCKIWL